MNEIEREIKRVQELKRSREIESMFNGLSDSEHITFEDYQQLPRRFKIDKDFAMLVELLGKKLDRERKKTADES